MTANDVTCTASAEETFTVTVNIPTTGETTATACESFDWYEQTITESGDYTHTLAGANINGCDSIVTLHLTINHNVAGDTTAVAVESFDWYEHNITESGNYTHTFTAANECDSIVTLNITIFHNTTGDTTAVACESFDWYEHVKITESCDNLTHTFTTANGADSVVTLHLTILNPNAGTVTISGDNAICQNGSTELTASVEGNNGNVTYAWNTQETGASITVNPTETTEYSVIATATLTTNNVTCTATTEKTFTVTVNLPTYGIDVQEACESFDWYEHHNITESCENLTHTLTGANVNGCDSIITLHLTINNNVTADTTAIACETFNWYDHNNITESCDDLTHTFQTVNGCDSIVTLHLTILKPNAGTLSIDGESIICKGESTALTATTTGNNGQVTYAWSNDATSETTTVNPTETTEYTVTATAMLSVQDIFCTATAEKTFTVTVNLPTTGIDVQTTCDDEFTWIDGNPYYESTNDPTWILTNAAGCDSVVTLHLTIFKPQNQAFYVTECETYTWEDGDGEIHTQSGEYLYSHQDDNGCWQVDTLYLTINHGTHQSYQVEACEEYEWFDGIHTESGIFTYQHETSTGDCPDVDTLYLTINKPVDIDTTIQVCHFPHTFMGRIYTEPTTDELTIVKIDNSCDSIHYHITVSEITNLTYNGHEYSILKLGSDCWFAENLRVETDNASAYQDDYDNVEKFGLLYTWYDAVGEEQPQGTKATSSNATTSGVCPEGWTLPGVTDFENLIAAVAGDISKLKSADATTWITGSAGSNNGIGFNTPAGGFYNPEIHQFERLLLSSKYWTATAGDTENEKISVEFSYYCSGPLFSSTSKDTKLSIRCINIR